MLPPLCWSPPLRAGHRHCVLLTATACWSPQKCYPPTSTSAIQCWSPQSAIHPPHQVRLSGKGGLARAPPCPANHRRPTTPSQHGMMLPSPSQHSMASTSPGQHGMTSTTPCLHASGRLTRIHRSVRIEWRRSSCSMGSTARWHTTAQALPHTVPLTAWCSFAPSPAGTPEVGVNEGSMQGARL